MAEVATAGVPRLTTDMSKKHTKHGDNTTGNKSNKRHRESNATEGLEREHKRSKSGAALPTDQTPLDIGDGDSASNHRRKSKKLHQVDGSPSNGEQAQDKIRPHGIQETIGQDVDKGRKKKKTMKQKASKGYGHLVVGLEEVTTGADTQQHDEDLSLTTSEHKKKREKKSKKHKVSQDGGALDNTKASQAAIIDVNLSPTKAPDAAPAIRNSSDHQYPFYTQTVSQYLPLHPLGIVEPIQGYADQHLKPLLNRYVPSIGGVLLAYRNPRIGEVPGKSSLTNESGMDDIVVLESINEYAVSFSWLTVEIDFFRPARGAWLEGLVNLQSGGHIGVVCWGKFNAAIEAERLPRGWRWIDLFRSGKKNDKTAPEITLPSSSPQDEAERDDTQVHTAGYWVDEQGSRIKGGTSICFRIRNYEVGISGDYGYLSIEGTMLTEEEEEEKVREEMETLRRRQLRYPAVLHREQRRLPESSMTKFGKDEVQEDESQRTEVWKSSHTGSETDA
ncbi:hypothetical protein F5Y19DRAFT_69830 [Xylariaceae sp. FL1651]|nr:hypothetical protein F5Y19DRAFT_69830 [Xylariaceae sp. FL1651]